MDNQEISDFERELNALFEDYKAEMACFLDEIEILRDRVNRLPDTVASAHDEFEKMTGLTSKDAVFVIFATILQIVRQELVNKYKDRLKDDKAAKPFNEGREKSTHRMYRYYASIEEIKTNPVPFDTMQKEFNVKDSCDNPNLNGVNHRYKTLGHDPLLGWIFGTFNIMTNTLTMTEGGFLLKSYHVHTGEANNGIAFYGVDKMDGVASTYVIFESVIQRINKEGKNGGWQALGAALAKEATHLLSDARTAKSLPLPIVSWLSPNLSELFNICGVDTYSLTAKSTEAIFAELINIIISKLHMCCYKAERDGDKDLYRVRNMKIVTVSGELAIYCSSLSTLVRAYMGDASTAVKFDYGGTLVALNNILNNPLKIAEIKHEYVLNKTLNSLRNNE